MEKGSLEILRKEADDFARVGAEINIANPQSMSDGNFSGKYLTFGGERKLDCTRLDYLGLGSNPLIRKVMVECIENNDLGCPASQMVMKSGSTVRLEKAIADLHGMKESIIFVSGYPANDNIIQGLGLRMNTPHLLPYVHATDMGNGTRSFPTEFYMQEESHFSLQHAARLAKMQSRDKCFVRRFTDTEQLIALLRSSREKKGDKAVRVIVTDSLSSATGKIFDIAVMCAIAEEFDCIMYVDEAHAVGVVGSQGQGVASSMTDFGRFKERMLIMGTLTKTLTHLGGYVTMASASLSCFLRFCSPQYIFSAPLPPWMAESVIKTIGFVSGEYGEKERQKLNSLSLYMREELVERGFDTMGSSTHIIPVLIRDDAKADKAKTFMEQKGFISSLFKYPAVPRGSSLVRFSLCSDNTREEVDGIIESLVSARSAIGF